MTTNRKLNVHVSASRQQRSALTTLVDAIKRTGHRVPLPKWLSDYHFSEDVAREKVREITECDVFVWITPPDNSSSAELGVAIAANVATGHPYVLTVAAETLDMPLAALRNRECVDIPDVIRAIDGVAKGKTNV